MVCVRDGNRGCSGDGGEELAGLKKLVKGKKCNQCKATNKQKVDARRLRWANMGGTCCPCALYRSFPKLFFFSSICKPIYVLSRGRLCVRFYFSFSLHTLLFYRMFCFFNFFSLVFLNMSVIKISLHGPIGPPQNLCKDHPIAMLHMISEISWISYNSLLPDRPDKKQIPNLTCVKPWLTNWLTGGGVERWGR